MLSYYVIYYEKFRKVMQQTEKEALILPLCRTTMSPCFNVMHIIFCSELCVGPMTPYTPLNIANICNIDYFLLPPQYHLTPVNNYEFF